MNSLLKKSFALLLAAALPLSASAAPGLRSSGSGITLSLESEGHGALPTYYQHGVTYVLGENGDQYSVRLTNSSGERVEAVVTVDGRDAITGDQGDWRNQRGYILGPYGSIVVDGFRKSFNEVATFRFTSPGQSYSARRGTPKNVGVIGVAVFHERHEMPQAMAPLPVQPGMIGERAEGASGASVGRQPGGVTNGGLGWRGDDRDWGAKKETESAQAEPRRSAAGEDERLADASKGDGYANKDAPAAPPATMSVPDEATPAGPVAEAAKAKPADSAFEGRGAGGLGSTGTSSTMAARPAPPRKNNLGTEYGENRYSPVTEAPFQRRGSSPDMVLGLYYDDARGLAARGIRVYSEVSTGDPQPFPANRRFAPPPP